MTDGNARAEQRLRWRKSSYSSEEGGECVEVAAGEAGVHVRDSKDRDGVRLTVGRGAWRAFVRFAEG